MKKIFAVVLAFALAAGLFAGVPHPVFVEYTGSPVSFDAYLGTDSGTILTEESVGCGILTDYNLIMVECGNFPIWEYADVLYILIDGEYTQVILGYDNVQALTGDEAVWYPGTPGGAVTTQNEFATGWNLWSHNVVLENDSVSVVFESLENLTKVKSITESYDPSLDPQFNTLYQIVDGYGYWVQVSAPEVLEFTDATPLEIGNVDIDLATGWNLIGYIPQDADSVAHAYAEIITAGELVKVKSITESYDPSLDPQFNTLEILYPGNGYWINVSAEIADFNYPMPVELPETRAIENYIWTPVVYTNSTCAYAMIDESYGQIAAFAGEECRGITEINNGYVSLVINGEEAETVNFKLYQNGVVTNLSTQITTAPGEDVFFEFTSHVPVANVEMGIYPNPFNPQTTIAYELSQAGMVNVCVYNVKGQKVAELVDEDQDAGQHSVVWNAQDQASGIYFVKMNTENSNQVQKVILMK